jgi:hypothetical protein
MHDRIHQMLAAYSLLLVFNHLKELDGERVHGDSTAVQQEDTHGLSDNISRD